jgi:nitric oxide dioxygenase
MTAPTERDLVLVRNSFDKLIPVAGLVADLFYQRLFCLAPSVRRMFPADMRDQKRSLILEMAAAVQGLHDFDRLAARMKALGARHAGYGVEAQHYTIVGEALIFTLELGLGDAFTPEVRQAWTRLYGMLAALMQEGAREVRTMQAAE